MLLTYQQKNRLHSMIISSSIILNSKMRLVNVSIFGINKSTAPAIWITNYFVWTLTVCMESGKYCARIQNCNV